METVPLRHGLTGPCDATVRQLDGADALALAEAHTTLPAAMLATALLTRVVMRMGDVAPVTPPQVRALTASDRERLLLAVYALNFGPRLELVVRCPACGELAEIDLAPAELLDPDGSGPRQALVETKDDALRIRLPTGADQEAVAGDPKAAASLLMERCVSTPDGDPVPHGLAERAGPALDAALHSLDPLVGGELGFPCPACAAAVPARLDGLTLLLARLPTIEALDAGTLALARTYGWREPDIQAIPLARRARYVTQVKAA